MASSKPSHPSLMAPDVLQKLVLVLDLEVAVTVRTLPDASFLVASGSKLVLKRLIANCTQGWVSMHSYFML